MIVWYAWVLLIMLGIIGALGGFVNWLFNFRGEGATFTDLFGNVLFGALGPIFTLGIYGEVSSIKITETIKEPTVGVLVSSLALGFGGARIWSLEVARRQPVDTRARLAHATRILHRFMRDL